MLQYKSAKNGTVDTRVEKRPTVHHESIDHDYVSKNILNALSFIVYHWVKKIPALSFGDNFETKCYIIIIVLEYCNDFFGRLQFTSEFKGEITVAFHLHFQITPKDCFLLLSVYSSCHIHSPDRGEGCGICPQNLCFASPAKKTNKHHFSSYHFTICIVRIYLLIFNYFLLKCCGLFIVLILLLFSVKNGWHHRTWFVLVSK